MSKPTTSRLELGAARRQRSIESIIDAATPLFDLHGWYDVTIVDIAREAGVSERTVCNHFGVKRFVALAAYNSVLQRVLTEARAEPGAREALITFAVRFGGAIWAHPALAVALHSAGREAAPSPDVEFVDFDQLAKAFTDLLNEYWKGRRGHQDHTIHSAEMYLAGMLDWTLRHKDESNGDAAVYVLYQVLLRDDT